MQTAIVLIGHGAPPTDAPRELVAKLKRLEGERRARKLPMGEEERAIDAQIRALPRTTKTDPYGAGVEAIAAALRPKVLPARVVVAYNEFCAPSIETAVDALVAEGIVDITLATTMPTPGGVHAEVEIPEALAELRERHPQATLRYAWPFDLDAFATLLAGLIAQTTPSPG
jgi:sirohydrochlorin cobaltochelatase